MDESPGSSGARYDVSRKPRQASVMPTDELLAQHSFSRARTPAGAAPNPRWQFDGTVDLLIAAPKG